jgi:hypothetical protein
MGKIFNTDVKKRLIAAARLSPVADDVPEQLSKIIVPTLEVNPELSRKINVVQSINNTTNATYGIYTVPSGLQDFYLCGFTISLTKDAANDCTTGAVGFYATLAETNQVSYLGYIPVITLTASSDRLTMIFDKPIKLSRGTSISFANIAGMSLGLASRSATIYGYIDNNVSN